MANKDVYQDKDQLPFKRNYEVRLCEREGTEHTTKKGPHYHWYMTGFCLNRGDEGSHRRCPGVISGTGSTVNCICYCHHLKKEEGQKRTIKRPPAKTQSQPTKVVRVVKRPSPNGVVAQPATPAKIVRRIRPR